MEGIRDLYLSNFNNCMSKHLNENYKTKKYEPRDVTASIKLFIFFNGRKVKKCLLIYFKFI